MSDNEKILMKFAMLSAKLIRKGVITIDNIKIESQRERIQNILNGKNGVKEGL